MADLSIRRLRPSFRPIATNALPRPHCSDSNFSVFPNKGWVGSITLIADITRSNLGVLCRVRRYRYLRRHPGSPRALRAHRQHYRPHLSRRQSSKTCLKEKGRVKLSNRGSAGNPSKVGPFTRNRAGPLREIVHLCSSLSCSDIQRIPQKKESIYREMFSAVDVVIDAGTTTAFWPWNCYDRPDLSSALLR